MGRLILVLQVSFHFHPLYQHHFSWVITSLACLWGRDQTNKIGGHLWLAESKVQPTQHLHFDSILIVCAILCDTSMILLEVQLPFGCGTDLVGLCSL